MAQVTVNFDTVSKNLTVAIDGVEQNISHINFESFLDFEGETLNFMHMHLRETKDDGITTRVMVTAEDGSIVEDTSKSVASNINALLSPKLLNNN